MAQIISTARAPISRVFFMSSTSLIKSLRSTGSSTAFAIPSKRAQLPPKLLCSVTTDSAEAPAAASSFANCTGSLPRSSSPSLGEPLFISGITGIKPAFFLSCSAVIKFISLPRKGIGHFVQLRQFLFGRFAVNQFTGKFYPLLKPSHRRRPVLLPH